MSSITISIDGKAPVTYKIVEDVVTPAPTPTPTPPPVTPPTNAVDLGTEYPTITKVSLMPGQSKYFFLKTPRPGKIVSLQMTTTDWAGNLDIIASNIRQPKIEDIISRSSNGTNGMWYGPVGNSNESLGLNINPPTGTVIFVTVCNRSTAPASAKLYWTLY